MRLLAALVLLEALALAVLLAFWLGGASSGAAPVELAAMPDAPDEALALSSSAERSASLQHAADAGSVESDSTAANGFGIVAHGVVLDELRRPIEGARLTFGRDAVYESGTSAKNGAFAIADLASGAWELSTESEGFAVQRRKIDLDVRPWQRLEIVLRPWYAVKVRFATPSGEPLLAEKPWGEFQEPEVVATREPLQGDLPMTKSPPYGRISAGSWASASKPSRHAWGQKQLLEAGFVGELRLNQEPPLYASLFFGHVLLQTKRIDADQRELTFEIDAARLRASYGEVRLRLIDGATGAPLADEGVDCSIGPSATSARTDSEGRAQFERVFPGIGILYATPRERAQLRVGFRMPPGGSVDLGDLVVSPLAMIAVRIVDAEGRGVPNPYIACIQLDVADAETRQAQMIPIGDGTEGRFTLRSAGRHRYALIVQRGSGFAAFATVDARNEDPPETLFTLRPTTRVVLRGNADKPTDRVLRVLAGDGTFVQRVEFADSFVPRALHLPPGAYTAEIHDANGMLVHTSSFSVGSEPMSLEIP